MADKALEGVKVLELAQFVAGPYCSKLLADLGAEVIKVERPGLGDSARWRGPFFKDTPHPEGSAHFLYLNTNKRSITLNVNTPTGKEIIKKLVAGVDILIEDNPPSQMEALGLDYPSLSQLNPGLIMTSITPFGQTGPYRHYKAYHLNICHAGGQGYLCPPNSPTLDREPLREGGLFAEYATGVTAGLATLAAIYFQRITGQGQHVDTSQQEVMIGLQRVIITTYPNEGVNPSRLAKPTGMGGMVACKDGYVVLTMAEDHQWWALIKLLGDPEWAKDEKWQDIYSRAVHYHEVEPFISDWMMRHTRQEIYHWGQAVSCPVVPVLTAEEVVNCPQLLARGFFREVEHPHTGRLKYPSAPYQFSETPWAVDCPTPQLGQHNQEIYGHRLGYSREELVRLREAGII